MEIVNIDGKMFISSKRGDHMQMLKKKKCESFPISNFCIAMYFVLEILTSTFCTFISKWYETI